MIGAHNIRRPLQLGGPELYAHCGIVSFRHQLTILIGADGNKAVKTNIGELTLWYMDHGV
jgi:hypothetical protein